MNHALPVLAAVFALAASAHADDLTDRPGRSVESVVTLAETTLEIETPLPHRLGEWTDDRDELDLREAHALAIDLFPQARHGSRPPFIDWEKLEVGGFVGAVKYSPDFKAKTSYVLGLTTRVPAPGLGRFGFYAEAFLSYVNRDLLFVYKDKAGTWFGGGVGADYTILKGELGYIRPQAGVMYAYWNGVNSLDNGIGITVGLQFGLFWIKGAENTSVILMPQIRFQKSDYMIFIPIGLSVDF